MKSFSNEFRETQESEKGINESRAIDAFVSDSWCGFFDSRKEHKIGMRRNLEEF